MEIELIFAFARAKKVLRGPYIPKKERVSFGAKDEGRGRKARIFESCENRNEKAEANNGLENASRG